MVSVVVGNPAQQNTTEATNTECRVHHNVKPGLSLLSMFALFFLLVFELSERERLFCVDVGAMR